MTHGSERLIPLGFEIGSGERISIPLRHLAVTGQTQESGKTTTLEALAIRAERPALAFVTKRGEGSFTSSRRVEPYFRDRADWQFVTSIIDATLQEKNKFLRPWIMRICRTTQTLADVHRQVRQALKTAKGIHEGVYTQLDAYLDLIVPEIARVPMTPGLALEPGLNVMDLSEYRTPMQMLFVQSAIDWVNAHRHQTIVIVPEAWEFVPETKGSPVKASAIDLVRKGGGIGNYIWVDSQDMAGVDKTILRGCTVWLIGVQREANEIKRNLANIPKNIRHPTPADIAGLDRGQFYACWKDRTVKVYVQPAWLSDAEARVVARGERLPAMGRRGPVAREAGQSRIAARLPSDAAPAQKEVDEMTPQQEKKLDTVIDTLNRLAATMAWKPSTPATTQTSTSNGPAPAVVAMGLDEEQLYQAFKARLIEELPRDPRVMDIVVSQPELRVRVTRPVLEIDGDTLQGRIARLIADGFFDQPTTTGAVCSELNKRGFPNAPPNVAKELGELARLGFVTRDNKWYRLVPGMKVSIVEATT